MRHLNEKVFSCRIKLLEGHFGIFYNLVNALTNKDKKALVEAMKDEVLLKSYGFYKFIKRKQFKINTI